MKLLILPFVLGPALLGFSVAYWIRRPDDWTGPAVMIPLALAATLVAQHYGRRFESRLGTGDDLRLMLVAARWGGLCGGLVVAVLAYFVLLAPAA